MIVREREKDYVMIEQDNHAHISGDLVTAWKDSLFIGRDFKDSVEYAIYHHDYGWNLLDKQPFWNDKKQAPYTFLDFPTPSKTVFYKHGIDAVEKADRYAALLCSKHYSDFLLNDISPEARDFVQSEADRRQWIIDCLSTFDPTFFAFHYGLLQLCDSLSLYICLNEPGALKKDEHPFFQDGVPVSDALQNLQQDKLNVRWKDNKTIEMSAFPFNKPLRVQVKQKVIAKRRIAEAGLITSYQEAFYEDVEIYFLHDKNPH